MIRLTPMVERAAPTSVRQVPLETSCLMNSSTGVMIRVNRQLIATSQVKTIAVGVTAQSVLLNKQRTGGNTAGRAYKTICRVHGIGAGEESLDVTPRGR